MDSATETGRMLYCIPMMVETQKEPLGKYCFGSCGKILISGAIEIEEVGPCWVCIQDDCPYETGHTEVIGTSEVTGEPVCIRGLEIADSSAAYFGKGYEEITATELLKLNDLDLIDAYYKSLSL